MAKMGGKTTTMMLMALAAALAVPAAGQYQVRLPPRARASLLHVGSLAPALSSRALLFSDRRAPPPQLEWVGTYDSYTYDDDAAEKVAWDAIQQVAVVTNANEGYARRSAGRSTDAHAEPATDLPYAPVQPRRYYRPL